MDTIDKLINEAFTSGANKTLLRQNFELRLDSLGLSFNQFLENYEMTSRATHAILDGNFKYLDPISLLKLGSFLNVTPDEIWRECISYLPSEAMQELDETKKKTFILDNFNLNGLKQDGVINSLKDFNHIEKSLLRFFGLKDLYDYTLLDKSVGLFSSVKTALKDSRQKNTFKNKAIRICKAVNNPNPYDQERLKQFFPRIRGYSTNVETGLLKVIKELYRIGITVIVHPSLSLCGARGITIPCNEKPAIVLTDYGKKYSTLWFTLLHELHHVVFKWEEIKAGKIHVTDEDDFEDDTELAANTFAREYMFPKTRMESIVREIHKPMTVKNFADESQVHHSIIYDNYCYDNKHQYPRYSKFIRIPWNKLGDTLLGSLSPANSPAEFAKYYHTNIFTN